MQTFLKIVSPHAPVNSLFPASSPLFRATGTIRNRRKTRRNTVGKDRPVTFNRYILFRMVVEFVGAIACAIQMFQHHTWPGIITMGVFALVWAIGEIWLSTVYNRAHPRRDELSDEHQATAIRFTFFVLVVALVVLGFAGMIVTLFRHAPFTVPAMALPTLGMLALAIADARYLWLEHEGGDTDED